MSRVRTSAEVVERPSTPEAFPFRKVWREGLEVAMNIKGSQGRPRVEWLKQEHPFTRISDVDVAEVYANHVEGLQRALNVQRFIHNWVRPHGRFSLKKTTCHGDGMDR